MQLSPGVLWTVHNLHKWCTEFQNHAHRFIIFLPVQRS